MHDCNCLILDNKIYIYLRRCFISLHFISGKVIESVEEMDDEMAKMEEEQEKLRQQSNIIF